jgi:GlpG protein
MQPSTIKFIAIFIFGMAGIQLISFLIELFSGPSVSPGIANTAHLTGGVVGYVLGRLKFFSWKT